MTDNKIEIGFGHTGTIRNGNRQAVRPLNSEKWDVFESGSCIATGLDEAKAREMLAEES